MKATDNTIRVHLTPKSGNAKTGPIPVTTTGAQSCPDSCPLKSGGCYAKGGPGAIHWRKVTNGERGGTWGDLMTAVAAMPEGQLWRHNQAGDLPHIGGHLNPVALNGLVRANRGRRGFTYTHHDMVSPDNRSAILDANLGGFTVNLSANDLEHADALADLSIAPVVTLLPIDQLTNTTTPKGRKVVICPAVTGKAKNCAECGLCQRQRAAIVGFPAHGASKRKANAIANGSTS